MDQDQLPSILGWLKGLVASKPPPDEGKTYLAPPRSNYPTDEDVDFARKNDYSYGQPWAPEFEDKSVKLLTNPNPNWGANAPPLPAEQFNTQRFQKDPRLDLLKGINAKAALASEGSALAKLGFDPSKTAVDVFHDPVKGILGFLGRTRDKPDEIYANAYAPSAVVHESIHRGIDKLQASPYWKDEFNAFAKGTPNEMLVRHLMQKTMGDPETAEDEGFLTKIKKFDPEARMTQTREAARKLFDPKEGSLAKNRVDLLSKMEEAAANYIAAKHPGGPR